MLEACRTCLGLIDVDNLPFYKIEEEDMQLSKESCRYKLLSVIPEMNSQALNITSKALLCTECHGCLETFFEFKEKCLKTENIIMRYLQTNADLDSQNLDLKDVSAFSMSYIGDIMSTTEETSIDCIGIEKEVALSEVDENFDENNTVLKYEVYDPLTENVEVVHLEEPVLNSRDVFKCQVCMKEFERKSALEKHMFSHTNEWPYKCTVCTKGFTNASMLRKHSRTHSELKYECEVCNKKFGQYKTFKEHTLTHPEICNNTCKYCDRSFTKKTSLKKHIWTHTGEQPHRCEICDKRFVVKRDLKDHLNTHTGERPYVCIVCDKGFCSNHALTVHLRRHTDVSTCNICDKDFYSSVSLKTHMRTHSKERPHQSKTKTTTINPVVSIKPVPVSDLPSQTKWLPIKTLSGEVKYKTKCCVPECDDKVSRRHTFPKDLDIVRTWIEKIRNPAFKHMAPELVRKKFRICHRHFSFEHEDGSHRGLLPFAIPTIHLPA